MRKTYLHAFFFIIFSLLIVPICAQQLDDILCLKDGNILNGYIAQQIPDSEVNRSTLSGYTNISGINFLANNSGGGGVSFFSVHGYRFNNRLMPGAGTSFDLTQWHFLDFFGQVRYDLIKGRTTPFVYGDCGIGIPIGGYLKEKYEEHSGNMWAAGIGMRFFFRKSGSLIFSSGIKRHNFSSDSVDWAGNKIHTDHRLTFVSLILGLSF
ncbi:MAG TPA: hypothetical protein VE978_15400 [Chitinophagales bacterium]|nr:hypothetical protein [Chitinophagales bacterium]